MGAVEDGEDFAAPALLFKSWRALDNIFSVFVKFTVNPLIRHLIGSQKSIIFFCGYFSAAKSPTLPFKSPQKSFVAILKDKHIISWN